MGSPIQRSGAGDAQCLWRCMLGPPGLWGGAGMAEGYKCVPKLMVVIEWELALPFIPRVQKARAGGLP